MSQRCSSCSHGWEWHGEDGCTHRWWAKADPCGCDHDDLDWHGPLVRLRLIRNVTRNECPWIDSDLPADLLVWQWFGPTYSCVAPSGVACSMAAGKWPFFELPRDALELAEQ